MKTLFKETFTNKKVQRTLAVTACITLLTMLCCMGVFAETPSLSIDFNVESMFTWAQTILNALMPVVYITMGLSLGFLIIGALKRAFN